MRLTRRCKDTQEGLYASHVVGDYVGIYSNTEFGEAVECLAYYEDLEELGRLVILPCRRGAQVYEIVPKCTGGLWCPYAGGLGADRCSENQCGSYIKACLFDYWMLDKIGKTIFLTRKEAEEVLANEVEAK